MIILQIKIARWRKQWLGIERIVVIVKERSVKDMGSVQNVSHIILQKKNVDFSTANEKKGNT